MRQVNFKLLTFVSIAASALTGCGDLESGDAGSDMEIRQSGLTAAQRLQACQQDPRVVALACLAWYPSSVPMCSGWWP